MTNNRENFIKDAESRISERVKEMSVQLYVGMINSKFPDLLNKELSVEELEEQHNILIDRLMKENNSHYLTEILAAQKIMTIANHPLSNLIFLHNAEIKHVVLKVD